LPIVQEAISERTEDDFSVWQAWMMIALQSRLGIKKETGQGRTGLCLALLRLLCL
jgi:hypothetical protein